MSALITTEILGEHPSLTSITTEFDVSTTWIRGGEGLVGFGVYKKYEVSGEDRFKEAHKWWQQILAEFTIQNNVHGIGTGPILFTSFAFDPKDTSELIIPKIIIGQRNGKSWITWIGDQKQPDIRKIEISSQSGEITWANGTVEEEKWRNQVSKAIDAIKSGRLEKVVLARDLKANSTTKIDLNNLL